MANKPLILSDNFFDDAVLHRDHIVSTTGTEVAGSELFNISDNLRDVTRFTVSETDAQVLVKVDCGSAKSADCLIVDRGHNLSGKEVNLYSYVGAFEPGTNIELVNATVPSVPGGLPSDPNGCLTPDGVWWKTFSADTKQSWLMEVQAMGAGLAPILTGLYLGKSYRFPEYLDGPAAYDYRIKQVVQKNETSRRGVRVKRGIINYAEVDLSLKLDGSDFDAFNAQVRPLFFSNHPWWFCLDDSDATGAGLMRLFQLPGETTYDPLPNPVHREIRFLLEEVAPSATL
jgi:hypothetical protein